jgi:integrase
MNKALTDFAVKNAKAKSVGYEISDGGQRGLRLSVRPSGAKSWVVRFRHPVSGISRKLTLPPGLTLAQARKLASDAMFEVAQGRDPIQTKRAEKEAQIAAVEGTLASVVKTYMDLAGSKLRSAGQYRRALARDILPKLGERQVTELRRSELVSLFDKIERERGASTADLSLSVLRTVLHWFEKRSDTFRSPIISGMNRLKSGDRVRRRVLSDHELKCVWDAAGDERVGIYGQIVRFLALTGARRNEAAGLRRSEVEVLHDNGHKFTVWRLPASRSKNKREIVRPLSRAALAIIKDIPMIGEDSDFFFTVKGNKPLAMNYPEKKRLLDELAGVKDWRLHDLRRCFRSLLSRCRVDYETAERLLGHSRPTLDQIYNQHNFFPQMQQAVDRVASEIERIVEGGSGKVIKLRK